MNKFFKTIEDLITALREENDKNIKIGVIELYQYGINDLMEVVEDYNEVSERLIIHLNYINRLAY